MHEFAFVLQSQVDPETARRIAMVMLAAIPVIILVMIVILMVPFWFICKKAGLTPWLSMLCIIPSLGTLILLYLLAFSEWKVVPAQQTAWTPTPYPPQPPQPPLG
jgi:protein-S-isoprenylcysteine O-methyltransferase Ste14